MKTIVFELTTSLTNIVFPPHRVKTCDELMEICIRTCRELYSSNPLPDINIRLNTVVIVIRKMSRLFFFSENRYISIAIPITVQHNEDKVPQFYYNTIHIDSEIWSY